MGVTLNQGFLLSLESPSNYSRPNVVTNKFTWTGSIRRQLTLIEQGSNPGKPENFLVLFSQLDKLPLQLLTIPCCWHDCRNHLASEELYCNGSILIFLKELSLLTSMRRILRYEIFPWVFPKVQFWDLYSTFCILRHLLK